MFEIAGQRYRVISVMNDDARRYTQCDVEMWGDATKIGVVPGPIPYWDRDLGGSVWDDGASVWDGQPASSSAPTRIERPPSLPRGLEEPE